MLASEAQVEDIRKNAIIGQEQGAETWVEILQARWEMQLLRPAAQMQDRYNGNEKIEGYFGRTPVEASCASFWIGPNCVSGHENWNRFAVLSAVQGDGWIPFNVAGLRCQGWKARKTQIQSWRQRERGSTLRLIELLENAERWKGETSCNNRTRAWRVGERVGIRQVSPKKNFLKDASGRQSLWHKRRHWLDSRRNIHGRKRQ